MNPACKHLVMSTMMICITTGPVFAGAPAVDEIRFRVLLNDKEIGHHTFTITGEGGTKVVRTEAEFDVRVLFVSVYNYVHRSVETWENGCLSRIDSNTDDNGTRYAVNGVKKGSSFQLATLEQTGALQQECVMTFAYWDREFLSQSRLLNAQTGSYVEIRTEPLGKRRFQLADGDTIANGFQLSSKDEDLNIKVWYQEDSNRWLALESTVGNGRTLRYLPVTAVDLLTEKQSAAVRRRSG